MFYPHTGMSSHQCPYPRGKVIGGTGTINSLIYVRGSAEDYNWEKFGIGGWNFEDVLPSFLQLEKAHIDGEEGYHGHQGALDVNFQAPPHPLQDIFLQAAVEAGIPRLDFNGKELLGVGPPQLHTRSGKRLSGGRAFLDPVRELENLEIVTNALASKLLIEDGQVVGVEFFKQGVKYIAGVNNEVIVSGGSINTPQLLMLSGIGPKEELSKFGIPVIKDLPVGQNFKDHVGYQTLTFNLTYAYDITTDEAIKMFTEGLGPLANGDNDAAIAYVRVKNTEPQGVADLEFVFIPPNTTNDFGSWQYNFKQDFYDYVDRTSPPDTLRANIILQKPKSVGSVTLQSNSPMDYP